MFAGIQVGQASKSVQAASPVTLSWKMEQWRMWTLSSPHVDMMALWRSIKHASCMPMAFSRPENPKSLPKRDGDLSGGSWAWWIISQECKIQSKWPLWFLAGLRLWGQDVLLGYMTPFRKYRLGHKRAKFKDFCCYNRARSGLMLS